MKKSNEKQSPGLPEIGLGLDDLIRQGARAVIQQAIDAELAQLLEQYENVKTLTGQRTVVRNGYLPERAVLTAVGPVAVNVPKVRDRSGSGVKFNSALVPPYVRRSARVSAALPWLYLKGISTGDMSEALKVLVGEDAKGLSPNVVSRLKAQWTEEHARWNKRDLSAARYVYWWVDGIHTGLRSEASDGQCLLVIIGVTPDGRKERVAIGDGLRESKESWKDILLDLKQRGLQHGPLLAVGDGAMGFWAAREEVFPATRAQRCWFHKMGNVLNALPKSQHARCPERSSGNLDGGDASGGDRGLRALRGELCGEVSEGDREIDQGPRRLARLLRLVLPNTGRTCARPTRLNRPSPPCVTARRVRAIASRARRSWDWRVDAG